MGARILNRRPVGNPINNPAVTQRDVDYAAASYQRLSQEYGENNMATQRAYFKYVELRDAYEAKHSKARERRMRILNVTDRALRYRANADPPPGPKICRYCGSRRNVEVHHKDGDESNTERSNLAWACRSCNTAIGIEHARRGIGRRTHQYNPAAPTIEQYIYAVKEHTRGAHDEGGKIIHATPKSKRREYAKKIWDARYSAGTDRPSRRATRDSEVPF